MAKLFANSGEPDQMLHSTVYHLGLHCLPSTLLGVSRLKQGFKETHRDKSFKCNGYTFRCSKSSIVLLPFREKDKV